MADGGATSFIMLITALIISAAASVILIDSWSGINKAMDAQRNKTLADADTQVEVSGDTMNVPYDSANKDLTIYLQNSGANSLDEDSADISVMVEGEILSIQSSSILSGSSFWAKGEILKLVVRHTGSAYSNGDEVQLTVNVKSLSSAGYIGTDTVHKNLRLKV